MNRPNILVWDLETTPNRGYFWGLWNQNIQYNALDKERSIICGSWKQLDEPPVYTTSVLDNKKAFKRDVYDDYYVVKKLREVIAEADLLIAHNGDKYDLKFFNSRCIFNGFPPIPAKLPTVDTLKVAKKHFRFNSNRLDYIGTHLLGEHKLETSKGLWLTIVRDDTPYETRVKAVEEMIAYNQQDVILLEDVYKELRPFMDNHPNMNLLYETDGHACPNCGSFDLHKRGFSFTRTSTKQRFQCQSCKAWCTGGAAVSTSDKR